MSFCEKESVLRSLFGLIDEPMDGPMNPNNHESIEVGLEILKKFSTDVSQREEWKGEAETVQNAILSLDSAKKTSIDEMAQFSFSNFPTVSSCSRMLCVWTTSSSFPKVTTFRLSLLTSGFFRFRDAFSSYKWPSQSVTLVVGLCPCEELSEVWAKFQENMNSQKNSKRLLSDVYEGSCRCDHSSEKCKCTTSWAFC